MILLDFNPIVIASVHVAQNNIDKASDLNTDFVRHLFLHQLVGYKKQFEKYGNLVICCDSKNSWRKEYFPFYKASRKKGRETSGINWQVVFESIDILKQELDEYFPYKVVYAERAEADDVIAVLAKYTQENELQGNLIEQTPQPTMIVSADKDFKQLQIFENVNQYSPILGKRVVEPRPDLYLKEHIIRGDVGDGVPNILSDDDVFVSDKRQKPIRQDKLEKWLEASGHSFCDASMERNYYRNKKMVDLINEIPKDIQENIIKRYQEAPCEKNNLFNYFVKNKLKNLMNDIHNF